MMNFSPATLPRETRDSLLVLLAVGLVLLPHTPHLPLWATTLALAMLGWRAGLARYARPLPGRWVLAGLLALVVGATASQFRSIVGPDAGVALLVLLLVLKTLEMRARRDATVIFFLGFFALITVFLHSQSLPTAFAVILALWALLAALVNAHLPVGRPPVRQLLRQSGLLLLWGLPLMLLLFFFFPRLPPLWGLPSQHLQGRTGLSDEMQVGHIASLAQDSSVAMRVQFGDTPAEQTPPAQHLLYFRGPVLSQFDGRHWSATSPHWPPTVTPQELALTPAPPNAIQNESATASTSAASAQPLTYEVTLSPHRLRWLLTLDATPQPPQLAQRRVLATPYLQWFSPQPIMEVLRYRAQAQLHYQYGQELSTSALQSFVQLPPGFDPRTRQWADTLRATYGNDDAALVRAVLQHLRQGGYSYTLEPGRYPTHTADTFWFDSKQGFCEHIASAFAVLMRAANIPARVVTGYQGGERNPVDGLWTVRQSDAHAWTELWLPQQGWVRVDPTAAVAPARTDLLQRLAPAPSFLGHTVGRMVDNHWLLQIRANWEALNYRWDSWVLNYNRDEQNNILDTLGLHNFNAVQISIWLGGLALTLLASIQGLRWHQRRQHDPWLRLLGQARQKLQQQGLTPPHNATPRQLAQAAQQRWGDAAQPVQQWLLALERWRYAPDSTQRPGLQRLRAQWRSLRWPRP